jgi:glycosyltransferase involved in cell wall biosynthesis
VIELSVAAPVFNEAEGIERVVRHWRAVLDRAGLAAEIVLTDDGSTDDTGAVLARLAGEVDGLRVLSFRPNHGYGFALGRAVEATRGEWVVTLDSDGQFDLADALPMLARCRAEPLDFVTGYRRVKRDGAVRVAADRGLNLLVRGMFGLDLRDTNCALKVIRGTMARALRIEARGYPTPTEVTVKLLALGARGAEMPVTHAERLAGASKLKVLATAADMARFLLYLHGKIRLPRAGVIQAL